MTVIETTKPTTVHKRYTMGPDGHLVKTAIANITEGIAKCQVVPDADAMACLRRVTRQTNLVLCAGRWHGCDGRSFQIVPERVLAEMPASPLVTER